MPEKISKQYTGGAIDRSLNNEALKVVHGVSKDPAFKDAVRELIGEYRQYMAFRNTAPAKEQQERHLDSLESKINALLDAVDHAPETFKSYSSDVLFNLGRGVYEDLEDSIRLQLAQYLALMKHFRKELEGIPAWSKKNKKFEARFLSDVFILLGPYIKKKGNRADKAREIILAAMQNSETSLPESTESLLKLIPAEIKNLPTTFPK